jgi:hypothetical protein
MVPSHFVVTPRKALSADALLALLRKRFEQIPDARRDPDISLADALMSGLALFTLKDPSLLAFQERRLDENMKRVFLIDQVPSDTRMREILDPLDPQQLRPAFHDVFRQLQRGKALEPFVFHQGCYLLSLDGTEYFSSTKVHCDYCLHKENSKTGQVTYYHQMLGAVLVHPDLREVIPLAPEPIIQQDGTTKNDCERNAAKRLLRRTRQEHPHLKLIVVEDGLASNAPHVRELLDLKMHFILGAKPADHEFLFAQVTAAFEAERVTTLEWTNEQGVRCEIAFVHGLPLNESNQDLLVNFLHYAEYDAEGHRQIYFTWITDLKITRQNARHLVRGGRARWKIENETFNTLKNQGYQFEHNFGHGQQQLSVVLALLMMLAFLVDQTQQLCCPLFRAVWHKLGSKRSLWEKVRSHFWHFQLRSLQHLYEAILYDLGRKLPLPGLYSAPLPAPDSS